MAYISFEHFDDRPEAMTVVRRFFTDYAAADALMIDAHRHGGGAFNMMGMIVNRLFGMPRRLAIMEMARSVYTRHGAPFPVDGASVQRVPRSGERVIFEHWSVPHNPPMPDRGSQSTI